jgi:homoserine dehydrogenase
VLAKVTGIVADAGISIDAVLQREADEVGGEGSTSNRSDHPDARHARGHDEHSAIAEHAGACPRCWSPSSRIRKEELA